MLISAEEERQLAENQQRKSFQSHILSLVFLLVIKGKIQHRLRFFFFLVMLIRWFFKMTQEHFFLLIKKIPFFFCICTLSGRMKLNTKVAVDSQMVFQTWTSSAISHFSFRHFRKQNKKQVAALICINVVFALPCQSALHKWCWSVSPGPCILLEQNCGVPDFGKKCRCGVGQSHRSDCWSCSKRSRTPP